MPAPGPRPAHRSALRTFLGRPTLGGWLTIGNGMACVAVQFCVYLSDLSMWPQHIDRGVTLIYLILNFPFAIIYWNPNLGFYRSLQDVVITSVGAGLNSIIWGYGLAGLLWAFFASPPARTGRPADPSAAAPVSPGR